LSDDAASALALFQKEEGRTLFLSHLKYSDVKCNDKTGKKNEGETIKDKNSKKKSWRIRRVRF
jgi:hypothetical protein